ncbi:hypothetical protein HanRHA438_Chr13g0602571 [Helianthus annuus]|nr:hypothetical protein HanRHA438_Chr13g0602571 [Helianthus annuus]
MRIRGCGYVCIHISCFHEISKITLKLVHFHFCPLMAHTYIHYMRILQAGRNFME